MINTNAHWTLAVPMPLDFTSSRTRTRRTNSDKHIVEEGGQETHLNLIWFLCNCCSHRIGRTGWRSMAGLHRNPDATRAGIERRAPKRTFRPLGSGVRPNCRPKNIVNNCHDTCIMIESNFNILREYQNLRKYRTSADKV